METLTGIVLFITVVLGGLSPSNVLLRACFGPGKIWVAIDVSKGIDVLKRGPEMVKESGHYSNSYLSVSAPAIGGSRSSITARVYLYQQFSVSTDFV